MNKNLKLVLMCVFAAIAILMNFYSIVLQSGAFGSELVTSSIDPFESLNASGSSTLSLINMILGYISILAAIITPICYYKGSDIRILTIPFIAKILSFFVVVMMDTSRIGDLNIILYIQTLMSGIVCILIGLSYEKEETVVQSNFKMCMIVIVAAFLIYYLASQLQGIGYIFRPDGADGLSYAIVNVLIQYLALTVLFALMFVKTKD